MGTLVLLFVYTQGSLKQRKSTSVEEGKIPYMQVHQYQQETAMKIGIKKDQARFRKDTTTGHLVPDENYNNDFEDTHDLRPEKHVASEVLEDASFKHAVTLDQKMDNFLAKRQKFEELEEMKKKAYVDAFKREARAMGFEVIIDDNMQIVKVKKLKK